MIFGLAGCGSTDTVSDTADTSAAAESSVQSEGETSAPEEKGKADEEKGKADEENGETDEDQEAADAVIELIDQIGTVTEGSGDAITTARKAYKSLTDEQKELVTNYATLKAAEKDYAALTEKTDEENGETDEDQEAADAVIELIDQIGTVTEDSGDAITTARKAYESLTDEQKELVTNYATLKAAEEAYEEEQENQKAANQVIKLIKAIGTVTSDSKSAINKARTAYNKLNSAQKKLVTNYSKLEKAEEKYAAIADTEKIRTTAEKYVGKDIEKLIEKIGKADSYKTTADCQYANGETRIYYWGDIAVYATSKDVDAGKPFLIDRVK